MFSPVDSRKIVSKLLIYGPLVLSLSITAPVWAQVACVALWYCDRYVGRGHPQRKNLDQKRGPGVTRSVASGTAGFYTTPNRRGPMMVT